jgi:hypothetical protein
MGSDPGDSTKMSGTHALESAYEGSIANGAGSTNFGPSAYSKQNRRRAAVVPDALMQ